MAQRYPEPDRDRIDELEKQRRRTEEERLLEDRVVGEPRVTRFPVERPGMDWSPAQIISVLMGLLYGGLGILAAIQTGLTDMTNHVDMFGVHHTPYLAIGHMVIGAVLLIAGFLPRVGTWLMTLMGVGLLVAGIVVLGNMDALHTMWGVHDTHGWMYIVTGAIALLAGIIGIVTTNRDVVVD